MANGARGCCGDQAVPQEGSFIAPTVLTDVAADSAITVEEIFGPVVALQTFRDEADVIRRASDTEYGLASYFYSADIRRCLQVAGCSGTAWSG